jgi:hypothetical protein
MMISTAWTLTGVFSIGAVVVFVLTYFPLYLRFSAFRLARSIDLTLPDDIALTVGRRTALRQRGGAVGGVGGAVGASLALTAGGSAVGGWSILFLIGGMFTGIALGIAVVSLRAARPVHSDAVRVARASAVDPRDYLAPIDRIGTRVTVVLGLVAAVVAVVRGDDYPGALLETVPVPYVVVLAGVGVLTLVLFEIASRRVVAQPQFAQTQTELAWDDAMRATLLRDMVTAPLALGLYAFMFVLFTVVDSGQAAGGGDSVALSISAVVTSAIAVAFAIVSTVIKPQQHFKRRLWSNPSLPGVRF